MFSMRTCDLYLVQPAKNFFYERLEFFGILDVVQAKKMNRVYLIHCLRESFKALKNESSLPDNYDIIYHAEKNKDMPLNELIWWARAWIIDESKNHFRNQQDLNSAIQEIMLRIEAYDLMDDIRREFIPLYLKRIKLKKIKTILNANSYEKIELPPIIPPEYIKEYKK